MSRAKTLFFLLSIFCGSMVTAFPAAAEETVKRVRVDLDFEQLGIVTDGQPAGRIEVAIHCANCDTAHPLHHVSMEGDALVVLVEPIAGASKGALDLAAVDGIDISVEDAVEVATVVAAAQPPVAEPVEVPAQTDAPEPLADLEVIQREVLDVMEAAMAEARVEGAARLEAAGLSDTSTDAQPGSGSWVVERSGEVVDPQ